MSKHYRGFWNFAPLPECTTHVVEANTEDEAVELLGSWACAHRNCVDEPWDFEVEELDTDRFKLATEIAYYEFCNGHDKSPWEIYNATANPKALAEMARDFVGDLRHKQDIVEDFQTYTPIQRATAEDARSQIITILHLIREITMKVA